MNSRQDQPSAASFSANSIDNSLNSLIDWKSFDQGLTLAKDQSKPVFLYFYADWCTFCTKLKKTTFKDKAVLAYLMQNFISIKVDTEKDRQLAADWQVTGLPTLWFLDSEGQKLNAIPGYVDEKNFLLVLKYHFTRAYENQTFQEFVKIQ
ncbi:MAG: thioredoxin fold domain-containing protein [Proteobacteria bacterium]|nr:thioredoxin fold domain-containing protein [Pseudomonadota bacterium]MBU1543940.1 thioredoxin fold domain-containing protein [Pseudomonadota bacterium]MBU2430151.1 thioredoxin fold domain-containing protein [Pseudomonadota bacterium]